MRWNGSTARLPEGAAGRHHGIRYAARIAGHDYGVKSGVLWWDCISQSRYEQHDVDRYD
jgi:hypothetical protein